MNGKRGRPKQYNNKDVRITIRLSRQEFDRIRILADERDMSISKRIRRLINEYWEWR